MGGGGDAKHEQRQPDGAQTLARSLDRIVDESVAVAMVTVVNVLVLMAVSIRVRAAAAVRLLTARVMRVRAHADDVTRRSAVRSSTGAGGLTCSW